jgi:hypothetical protein
MGSFALGFGASSPYGGAGSQLPVSFFAHFPPEVGCIGFSGNDGDLVIHAKVTNLARQMLARSIVDNTSFKITQFSVGTGGYDPSYPISAIIVDPTQQDLISEVFRGPITAIETPLVSGIAKAFVCRLGMNDVKAGIGEIGLWAEILWSPFSSEIGNYFLFAVVHEPLNSKTYNHVTTSRVVIVF